MHYVYVFVHMHRYDDYNYGDVNQLMERSLKVYVKTVACHPEKTTPKMYFSFWRQFRHSEKVCDLVTDVKLTQSHFTGTSCLKS